MQKVLRIIRKKRNLRRLSALWLCLVMLELFCPVFCDEPSFAAQINSPKAEATSTVKDSSESSRTSISGCDHQNSGSHEQTVCNDECLCHAVAMTGFAAADLKDPSSESARIALRYGNPVFNSLPPPFQPPKNS